MVLLCGEAGENPARDRRRKAHPKATPLPEAAIPGNAIGENLEKVGSACAKVGISGSKTFIAAAASGPKEIHTLKENKAMKKSNFKKWLSCIACVVLIAAMALTVCACAKAPEKKETVGLENGKTYGQGSTSFPLEVTGSDGKKISVTVLTDKTVVGEALQELDILAGEEGPYGLYIKTVNGETLDYDTDGMYWAFYIDGAYAMTGIDQTNIEPGVTYALVAEKG